MKVGNNVTKAEAKKVEHYVKKCVRLLRKKEYELDLPKDAPDIAASCLEVKRLARRGAVSRAGRSCISINLAAWQFGNEIHIEYKAFIDHPIIGKTPVTDDDDHLLVTVAHEVCHHIQYRYCPRVKRFKENYRKPHGKCFQDLYVYLRRDLVNPILKERAG